MLKVAIAMTIAAAILIMPSNAQFVVGLYFPLEQLVLLLLGSLLTGRGFLAFRLATTVLLAAMLFFKLADIGTDIAFQRPFNPYLDLKLLTDGWNLLSRSVGFGQAIGIVCAGLLVWLLVAGLLYWSLNGLRYLSTTRRRRLAMASVVLLLAGLTALALQRNDNRFIAADAGPYFTHRIAAVRASIANLARFEQELQSDPVVQPPGFSALAGMDVVLIFIESYGRSAIEDPRYRRSIRDRLARIERQIGAAGLEARSGWLTSPTVGGLSWLAHATLLSGLWVDNQARYDRMIASRRASLNSLFRAAGWRTTAVMPAITLDWPEAGYFGYDSVHAAAGLGYAGKPFNWVTMPDQYTLAAFEKLERSAGHEPVMAEIALISSHAPWTPVPKLVDWQAVDDGRIFDAQASSGDPPSVVWSDPDRVRGQYLASIDYTLETLGSYMARFGDDTLFILVGDHQPASIITGNDASRDAPMHIVSDNPALLDRLDGWNWQNGMLPLATTPVYRMDEVRLKLVESFD